MKKYETYKNSGVEWIGEVPENWKTMRFKHFVDQITTPSTHPHKIALENIESKTGKFVSTDSEFEGNGAAFNVDDIVYGKLRPYLQKVWKAEFEGNAIGDFFVYRVKGNCLPSYLKYVMLSDNFTSAANGSTYGAKMPRVASEFIANSVWFLPSLSEQQAIASYLDYKVGQIDASVSAINSQIDDLKSYRQSIISEAVTKGLNINATMKDSGVKWIGEIPEGWEILKMSFILSGLQDGTHGTYDRVDSGYPLLSAKNVLSSGIILEEKESYISASDFKAIVSNGFPKKGDIALCCVGTVGRCCIYTYDYPMAFQRSVTFLRSNNKVKSKYLWYYLQSNKFQDQLGKYAKTSAQSGVYLGDIAKTLVILPSLPEQQAIASYLETKVSKIDSAISSLETQRDDLNALKQSIISEAVTGKIDVRDWKPRKLNK